MQWHAVMAAGAAEGIFGALLLIGWPSTTLPAQGIFVLLVAVFPANIYHAMSVEVQKKTKTVTLSALPS